MNFSNVELPSNKKFGFFFCIIFLILSVYLYIKEIYFIGNIFLSFGLLFFFISIVKAELLIPLNKLWMLLGLIIGLFVSKIVLAAIFFLLFTPISFIMRIMGRDELQLRLIPKKTHWIRRDLSSNIDSFKNQFYNG
tara:strand:- start:277 stop:684 length:408 start_codon:yes stop_codon:yes gene_type:complete